MTPRNSALLIPFFIPSISYAEGVPLATGQSPFDGGAIVQLLLGLAFVVGLIFVLAWVAKRNLTLPSNQGQFKVVATLPMGYREKLVIVQVGSEQLLLGVSHGRISKLHTLEQPLTSEQANDSAFASKFIQALQARQGQSEQGGLGQGNLGKGKDI